MSDICSTKSAASFVNRPCNLWVVKNYTNFPFRILGFSSFRFVVWKQFPIKIVSEGQFASDTGHAIRRKV